MSNAPLNRRPLTKLHTNQRGSVMIMTAILMAALILAVGLCIDVARVYMVRTELQNAADAAALAAARELNSGAGGIQDAVTRATTIVNSYGFNDASVSISATDVKFAINLYGTYESSATAEANPTNYRFVQVTTQSTSTPMLFSASVLGANHVESRSAVAGMSLGLNTICDFFPFAVALNDSDTTDSGFTLPAAGATMTLNFVQGNGNSMTLKDKDYIIIEVPEISGNGAKETIRLAAGVTSICQTLNVNVPFHATPSSNQNNGPRQITDGASTRFNIYANGPGQLNSTDFPPDTNIGQDLTFDEYKNRTNVTAPSPGPGQDDRRILIVPIVAPGTYTGSPVSAPTLAFGAFFLKSTPTVDSPCSKAEDGCAHFNVEWIEEALVIGRGSYTAGGGTSSLTLPVLYR